MNDEDDDNPYDAENGVLYVTFDRVSIAIDIEDFEDFYMQILSLREILMSDPNIVLGVYEENGVVKRQFLPKPDEDETEFS
jgi:hypothetical protein